MDIFQQHIDIKQALQKNNAYMYRNILPEEIDNFINKIIERMILTRYTPLGNKYQKGFEENQLRIEDLGNLVEDPYVADVILMTKQHGKVTGVSNYGEIAETNKYIFPLPEDYFILTRQRAEVFYNDCSDIGFKDVNGDSTDALQTTLRNITCYPINIPSDESVIGFDSIDKVEIEGDDSYVLSLGEAYTLPQDLEALKKAIIAKMREEYVSSMNDELPSGSGAFDDSNIYNEIYKESFYENKLLYVRNGFHNDSIDVILYDSESSKDYTITVKPEKRVFRYMDSDNGFDMDTGDTKYSKITIKKSNNVNVDNAFFTTDSDSINAIEYKHFLEISSDGSFVPFKCNIAYIRKPTKVSLARGVSCELAPHMHPQVNDDTVDFIRNVIENSNYQLGVLENKKKE